MAYRVQVSNGPTSVIECDTAEEAVLIGRILGRGEPIQPVEAHRPRHYKKRRSLVERVASTEAAPEPGENGDGNGYHPRGKGATRYEKIMQALAEGPKSAKDLLKILREPDLTLVGLTGQLVKIRKFGHIGRTGQVWSRNS